MKAFCVQDLRERTGELIRGAEAGHLSIMTKHGNPVFVAVPFDEVLLESGVRAPAWHYACSTTARSHWHKPPRWPVSASRPSLNTSGRLVSRSCALPADELDRNSR